MDDLLFLDELLCQKVPLLSVLKTVRSCFDELIERDVSFLLVWVLDDIRSGGVCIEVLRVAADLQFDIRVAATDSLCRPIVIELDAELLDRVTWLEKILCQ